MKQELHKPPWNKEKADSTSKCVKGLHLSIGVEPLAKSLEFQKVFEKEDPLSKVKPR